MASGDSGDSPSKVATAAMGRGSIWCGNSKILLDYIFVKYC